MLSLNDYPLPQILFYIDTPPEIGIARRAGRDIEEIYEKSALQEQIYQSYDRIIDYFADSGMITLRIDGTLTPERITEIIWSYFADMPKMEA